MYEQAIAAYQRQLGGQSVQNTTNSQSDLLNTIANLNKQIEELTKQLASKDNEIKILQARAASQVSTASTQNTASQATNASYTNLAKLLALKEQVLLLMEFYLQKMLELQGAIK